MPADLVPGLQMAAARSALRGGGRGSARSGVSPCDSTNTSPVRPGPVTSFSFNHHHPAPEGSLSKYSHTVGWDFSVGIGGWDTDSHSGL